MMTDAASNAIQTAAVCFAVAVAFYSVGSCMTSGIADRDRPQIECIKARGKWVTTWSGSACDFPAAISERSKQQ